MLLNIFGFLNFSFVDVIDILLVAILIYLVFIWIRGSAAMNIFVAIILLLFLRVIAAAFNMKLTSALLGAFLDIGVLALIIIFQPEIRHFLMKFGSRYGFRGKGKDLINKLLGFKEQHIGNEAINELAEACRSMSQTKTGALVVLQRKESLDFIIETGDQVDALVRRRLIMNIFFKNSPLHDGAMVISGDRIVAARCTLPITSRTDIPPSYGMRHKAAIGISEESDADVVVVSEETGQVSFVRGGVLTPVDNINTLKLLLGENSEKSASESPAENEKAEENPT
ncbi:MAG: diadenylate cyclase CdaA [Bacteroidales bacterium]|nr:diadenylate cyclase CdaA [Bacteroidales bacterium]MCI5720243.1 diadenylate cyclase CdaA [Bacteroidales bacterium]MDY2935233.1 diadenylate cyclase CdaA [Candidatus Cryptobacteroides sp.]MDY6321203.1 diadenylate cyclase CdaA [Bacteroidales bacterium]